MSKSEVIAIVDVGKTNKKVLLFDRTYKMVYEHKEKMEQTQDEDGFDCEDLFSLKASVLSLVKQVCQLDGFDVKAINFSGYGASFVHVGKDGNEITPLYNYLKPYPPDLQNSFYSTYGGEQLFARKTASPVLGMLNSGMQLYWLKYKKQEKFSQIDYSLHLPQYLGWLFSQQPVSEITSIGCHTNLWDFEKANYHDWVLAEGIDAILPPIVSSTQISSIQFDGNELVCGVGLHDSSAALVPYLMEFTEPFILISTGTWSISLNPFVHEPLTDLELSKDCLSYLQYNGKPVKASRLFLGNEHEECCEKIAAHFSIQHDFYQVIKYDQVLAAMVDDQLHCTCNAQFAAMDLSIFPSPELAYHMLISTLVSKQKSSTDLIMKQGVIQKIYVDGGFGKNDVFMHMLASVYPGINLYSSEVSQATALGAALAIHASWNAGTDIRGLISLRQYS